MSIQKLKSETTIIGKALSEAIDKDNPQEVQGKMRELSTLQAMASHMAALSTKVLILKEQEAIDTIDLKKYTAPIAKKKIEAYAIEEMYFKKLAEMQFASIKTSLEELRSQLSYLKEEFSQSKFHNS